jgi:hypothetical protein
MEDDLQKNGSLEDNIKKMEDDKKKEDDLTKNGR